MVEESKTPAMILSEIQKGLKSSAVEERLKSIETLSTLKYSSGGILHQLETMAIKDRSKRVRAVALDALDLSVHRQIFRKNHSLSESMRAVLVDEIYRWGEDGLLSNDVTEVLAKRYTYDKKLAKRKIEAVAKPKAVSPLSVAKAPVALEKMIAPVKPPAPKKPKRSLAQVLFSESSIKISLYLGAFFLVSAALIFAALAERFRLPILVVVSLGFLSAALRTKQKLPQASFTFFIIFSMFLFVDAGVLRDLLNLQSAGSYIYWAVINFLIAGVWGYGTWLYTSRFFSVATFFAAIVGVINFSRVFDSPLSLPLFLMVLVIWGALLLTKFLIKWQDQEFAKPLFIVSQISLLLVLLTSLTSLAMMSMRWGDGWWFLVGLMWLLASAAFVFSNLVWENGLFHYAAVGALIPVPWMILNIFGELASPVQVFFAWAWGTAFILASVFLRDFLKSEKWKKYSLPFLLGGGVILGSSLLMALARSYDVQNVTSLFFAVLGVALTALALHIYKPHIIYWSISLVLAISAFFLFFEFSFMENIEIFMGYKLFVASLLLLLPDSLLSRKVKEIPWRAPLQALGGVMVFAFVSVPRETDLQAALLLGAMALFFFFYALRLRFFLGYIATAFLAFSLLYGGYVFSPTIWLPSLFTLALFYYAFGYLLKKQNLITIDKSWADLFRFSGLILGSAMLLIAFSSGENYLGYYALLLAFLFFLETFLREYQLWEIGIHLWLGVGIYAILNESNLQHDTVYTLLIVGLLWLGLDMLFERILKEKRVLQLPVQIASALLILVNTLMLLSDLNLFALPATISFGVYALFFSGYAIYRKDARFGYLITSYLPLHVIALLHALEQEYWLLPLIILALLYYALGLFIKKEKWREMWIYSSLILATLLAFSAPFEDSGLLASVPVAITATLYAVHAFRKKNVWLGFPANGFYLMAYFMILLRYHVDQPQFFTLAAAVLGMLMHYLLVRSGSKKAAFITGMLSQLILLSTTYIQLVSEGIFLYFVILFFQALAVLIYGVISRSRSLVITPIAFLVLSVVTVTFSLLEGFSSLLLIGCAGVLLIAFGIGALLLREKFITLRDKLDDWDA